MIKLSSIFNSVIKGYGYERKGATWYKNNVEDIEVIGLQKSSYSNLYYVNISVFFKKLEPADGLPKEEKCHIRTRLSNKMIGEAKDFDYLFDLDALSLPEGEFIKELRECIVRNILPQMELIRNKVKLREYMKNNSAFLNMIPIKARNFVLQDS